MSGGLAARRGLVLLLFAAAGLVVLVQVAAVGALLNKAAAVVIGAEECQQALDLAQDMVWQVDSGLVAETGEEKNGSWSVAWRKSWCDELQGWRIHVTVAGTSLGRNWATQVTTFR